MAYLKSWLILDIISVIPLDLMASYGGTNRFTRMSRVGKIYRIVRLTKMFRLLKLMSQKNRIVRIINTALKFSIALERLAYIITMFIISTHITACIL
jgi:hypothetical protein